MKKKFQKSGISLSSLIHIGKLNFGVYVFLALTVCLTACTDDAEITPKLNTLEAIDTDITSATATLKGEFLTLGNMTIIEYGIEYSKSMIFSPSQTKGFTTAPSTGIFQVELINLEPKTIYYYKAYALINTANVYSKNYAHFTTK